MSEPIKHHYLPVFYLKQWTGSDGRVVRYYRPHKQVRASPISPANTGYEPLLYALTVESPERRQVIEKEFMGPQVDGPAAAVLQTLVTVRPPELTNSAKCDWVRFLISLLVRNPQKLADLQEKGRRQVEDSLFLEPHEYASLKGPSDPPTFLEWVETKSPYVLENVARVMLPRLIDNANIGQELINYKWFTLDFPESRFSLLTSDRPLVLTTGLKKERCVVALPLGPRLAFFAVRDKSLLNDLLENKGNEGIARALNESVVSQAYKHVYGTDDSQLRFVERRLRDSG